MSMQVMKGRFVVDREKTSKAAKAVSAAFHRIPRRAVAIVSVFCFSVISTILIVGSHAATPTASVETEAGTRSGNACAINDSSASGGSAVKFSTTTCNSSNPIASLPLIPWEGGSAYYAQFPKADAGGWSSPNFFPIAIFYNSISSNAEAAFDKSYGINTYVGMNGTYADYQYFKNNNMFWLGPKLNSTFPSETAAAADSTQWPGIFLDDEPDGRFGSAQNDMNYVTDTLNANPENGKFRQFNFTQITAGNYGTSNNTLYTQMINSYRGPISADVYWYTIPNCGPGNPAFDNLIYKPSDTAHCRTASSYGKLIKSLRDRDAADGVRKPIWQFIENLNGGPGEGPFYANITPGQLKGAAMSSVINEARGLFWFNTSLTGTCQAGSVLRQAQVNPNGCVKPQMDAMKEVNLQVLSLAPVLNTQSYQYTFGTNLDTMLKWYNGSAYIFAMISGDTSSIAGNRTFTLPSGLSGVSNVTVVNEGRTVPVTSGQFTDNFAAEYSYHIYKVTP